MKIFSFVLLIGFIISCASLNRGNQAFRGIANDPALVNALIDNTEAMRARNDIWSNPNSDRIFLSTFEFEEDVVGFTQVRKAVEAAKAGKTVDVVLDAAGHRLSDATLLYMVENGVNVHIFSPTFSWRGIKSRTRRLSQQGAWFADLQAVWRQATYRMHDKILIDFDSTNSNGGQVILGGRNARDSHYGIDERIIEAERSEGRGKKVAVSNPAFEYEHEVLIHNRGLHTEVETYVDDFLESEFTERLQAKDIKAKMAKSRAHAQKHGPKWRTKIAADKVALNDDFKAFAKAMKEWTSEYEQYVKHTSTDPKRLATRLAKIFSTHQPIIGDLVEEGLLNPKELDRLLKPLYGKASSGIVRSIAGGKVAIEPGKTKGGTVAEAMVYFLKKGQKEVYHNIKVKALPEEELAKFGGPLAPDEPGLPTKAARAARYKIFGIGFNFDQYDNMEKITDEAVEIFESKQASGRNWKATATEVDSVQFLHDTIDDVSFRKKSMDQLYDMISNCRKDCIWNSQYGSLTDEAQNAIENVIKQNSAVYRFVKLEFRKPNNQMSPEEKAQKIVKLLEGNIATIQSALSNEFVPKAELKADIADLQKQIEALIGDDRPTKSLLRNAVKMVKTADFHPTATKEFGERLVKIVQQSEARLTQIIADDSDVVERSLLKLRGYVDEDPKGVLPPHERINFHFMTNDVDSWAVGADKVIHADFHHNIMKKFRKMGPGLHVYGLNTGGRIHSKVATTDKGLVVSSMNADPRSEKFNTEVGVKIMTRFKGQELNKAFATHIESYMYNQTQHINNGNLVREKQCFDLLTRIQRRIMAPIL